MTMTASKRPDEINKLASGIRRHNAKRGEVVAANSQPTTAIIPAGVSTLADIQSLDQMRGQLVDMVYQISGIRDIAKASAETVLSQVQNLISRIDTQDLSLSEFRTQFETIQRELNRLAKNAVDRDGKIDELTSDLELANAEIAALQAQVETFENSQSKLSKRVAGVERNYFSVACYAGIFIFLITAVSLLLLGVNRLTSVPGNLNQRLERLERNSHGHY